MIAEEFTAIAQKNMLLRHYKQRIKKIRNSLDYLLEHPYSMDNSGHGGRKHKRDTPRNQRIKK